MSGFRQTVVAGARSLAERKVTSFLSAFGVIIGTSAIFAMICAGQGAKQQALQRLESLGMKNILVRSRRLPPDQKARATMNLSRGLALADMERIVNACPSLKNITALKEIPAEVKRASGGIAPRVVAVTPAYGDVQSLALSAGRFISAFDMKEKNLVSVLGHTVARHMWRGGALGKYIQIGGEEYRVAGIIARRSMANARGPSIALVDYNNTIFIPFGAWPGAWEGTAGTENYQPVDEIIVEIDSANKVMKSAQIIKRILEVAHSGVEDYSLIVPHELFRKARQTARTLSAVLGVVAFISLLVSGVGIMNIMLASVLERKKEIGIRRAVGARRKDIITQFLTESALLSSMGGLAGLGVGVALVIVISKLAGWQAVLVPWAGALSLVISVSVGIFFGLYPALKAADLDPVEAMRG